MRCHLYTLVVQLFFFNDTATTEIYTLSLHDALPIYHLMAAVVARAATSGIDQRSRNIETLAEIEKTALDYYATIRSLSRQRREAQIRHEQSNLPNPRFGGDAFPGDSMSYTNS